MTLKKFFRKEVMLLLLATAGIVFYLSFASEVTGLQSGSEQLSFGTTNLASMLGISSYAAKTVIDIVATASTVWAIVGIVAVIVGGAGIGVAILATAKTLIKSYGKKYAAAW